MGFFRMALEAVLLENWLNALGVIVAGLTLRSRAALNDAGREIEGKAKSGNRQPHEQGLPIHGHPPLTSRKRQPQCSNRRWRFRLVASVCGETGKISELRNRRRRDSNPQPPDLQSPF